MKRHRAWPAAAGSRSRAAPRCMRRRNDQRIPAVTADCQPDLHLRHVHAGDDRRLGSGHRVLQRHHRDERDVPDAHPLQLGHAPDPAAARDQLVVLVGRQDLDVPAPSRRALPHRQADDRPGGQGLDAAHDEAERRRRVHLGRGADHRHPQPVHGGVPPQVRLAARPRGVGRLLGLHLRHPGRGQREPDQVAEHPARRGHRPVHAADLEQRPGVRGRAQGLPAVLGRLERRALQAAWCSGSCRRTPRPRS